MMEENLQSGKGTRSSFTKWQLVRLPALFRNHRSYHWLSKNSFWILISSDLKNFGFWFACGPRLQGDAIRELQSTSGNLIMEELHCLYSRLSITDFSVYAKAFVWITRNCGNLLTRRERQTLSLPPEKPEGSSGSCLPWRLPWSLLSAAPRLPGRPQALRLQAVSILTSTNLSSCRAGLAVAWPHGRRASLYLSLYHPCSLLCDMPDQPSSPRRPSLRLLDHNPS